MQANLEILDQVSEYIDELDDVMFERAEQYYNDDKVEDISYSTDPFKCDAIVAGSGRKRYSVHIVADENSVDAYCACPVGYKCKHIGAVLLRIEEFFLDQAVSIMKGSAEVESPKQILSSHLKNWIDSLSQNEPQKSVNSPVKQLLAYSLSQLTFQTKIELKVYALKKDGSIGKTAPKKVQIANIFGSSEHKMRDLFNEDDWDIVLLALKCGAVLGNEIQLSERSDVATLLQLISNTGRLYVGKDIAHPLAWGNGRKGTFEWSFQSSRQQQKLVCHTDPVSTTTFAAHDELFYYDSSSQEIGVVDVGVNKHLIPKILKAPPLALDQVNEVADYFAKKVSIPLPIAPKKVEIEKIECSPEPHLLLKKKEGNAYSRWHDTEEITAVPYFTYKGHRVEANQYGDDVFMVDTEEGFFSIKRDRINEFAHTQSLSEINCARDYRTNCWDFSGLPYGLEAQIHYFFTHYHRKLKDSGWSVHIDPSLPVTDFIESDDWYVETSDEGNGWFDLEMGVEINGERINIIPLLQMLIKQAPVKGGIEKLLENEHLTLVTENKTLLSVPSARVKHLLEAFALEFESDSGNKLRLPEWNAHLLSELKLADEAAETRWFGDSRIQEIARSLSGETKMDRVSPSSHIATNLRPYQDEGLNWLQFLRAHRMNGILADDMGLGKTVQVLSHIQAEVDAGRATDPVLVVVPKSLLFNWVNEIKKHTPTLSYVVVHGADRKEKLPNLSQTNLILTTYSLIPRDKKELLAQHFHIIVLDEAQNIKNPKTKAYIALQQLKANHRLCLTGTPMENHLGELWSLYNFLMPGYLGTQKQFQQIFRKPIEKSNDGERQRNLSKRLSPVLLRRTKDLVAADLPKKTEIIERVEFAEDQRDLYETIRVRVQKKLMSEIAEKGLARSQIAILDALLKLRQVCCDPRLLKTNKDIAGVSSAKLDHLMELVPTLIEEGRGLLIFSQFTSMLELIQKELTAKEIAFTLLTGQTEDRKTPVDRFQNGEVPVMLLSLKAGGVGLNLTRADTVIHYDPWWNPAAENQATDRAHRIGQTNKVFVYKLIASGSIEEKILSLQQKKQQLIGALLENKDSASLQLSMEDLQDIFQPLGD